MSKQEKLLKRLRTRDTEAFKTVLAGCGHSSSIIALTGLTIAIVARRLSFIYFYNGVWPILPMRPVRFLIGWYLR